jgi:hypothetical protein
MMRLGKNCIMFPCCVGRCGQWLHLAETQGWIYSCGGPRAIKMWRPLQ